MSQIPYSKLVEIGVHNGQISQYLFKYRTIDAVKKLLENNSLWFSSPDDFNDPFDCQIVPNTNNSEEEIKEFITKNAAHKISQEKISELASAVFNEPNKWKNTIEGVFNRLINATGVCCFTKNERNLLMWSHYTDSHKGVCLKFDILQDPEYFAYPLPVRYTRDYPDYNHLTNQDELVRMIALSKSIDWEYEDEVRVLKINENGLKPFAKKALIEIIFGCKSSEKDIEEITQLSLRNNFEIKFRKAERKSREFGLEFKDL